MLDLGELRELWCQLYKTEAAFEVTDPGRALITGKCADIAKMKGPEVKFLRATRQIEKDRHNRHAAGQPPTAGMFMDKQSPAGWCQEPTLAAPSPKCRII